MRRRFRLDFADRHTEHAFKQMLEKRLLFSTCGACVVIISSCIVPLRECQVAVAKEGHRLEIDGSNLRTHRLLILILIQVVLPGCFLLAASLRLCLSWFEYVDWEMLAVAIPTAFCMVLPWTTRWTYARMHGQDPYEVWALEVRNSQVFVVFYLIAMFAYLCHLVPIRIHLMGLPVTLGCLSYIVAVTWLGSPLNAGMWDIFVILSFGMCGFKGARDNEQLSRHSWFAQKRAQTKSLELVQQCTSTSRILERLCDCLVQLDEKFNIIDPSPRLSALLFCSSTEILKDTKFCDYIDSEQDRHTFESELQKSIAAAKSNATDAGAAMVHINLRDAWGRKFAVSVYHTVVYDLDGQCGHMLACIEGQDRESPPTDANVDSFAFPLEALRDHSITHSIVGASEDSSESSSSVAMSTGASEVAAWIDVSSHNLEIFNCTTGFTQLRPIAAGTGLCRYLVGDQLHLRKWLEECFNAQANDDRERMISMPTCILRLQPVPTVAMGYIAIVKPDFESPLPPSLEQQTEDSIEDRNLLRIVMSDLKYHRLKKIRSAAGSKDKRQKGQGKGRGEVPLNL